MLYTDTNYDEIERAAWAAGDYRTAQLAEAAADFSAEFDRAEAAEDVIAGIRERITEANWRTGKKAELRELIEAILNELAEGGSAS